MQSGSLRAALLLGAVGLALTLAMPSSTLASNQPSFLNYGGGVSVRTQTAEGQTVQMTLGNNANFLSLFQTGWNSSQQCSSITQQLGQPGAAISGQTLSNFACTMGSATTLSILDNLANGAFNLDFHVPHNYVEFTSSASTPLGNPRFGVTYDLDIVAQFTFNGAPTFTTTSATANVSNATIAPRNLAATWLNQAASVMKTINGQDFVGIAEAAINKRSTDMTTTIQNLAANANKVQLNPYSQGYPDMHGALDNGNLVFTLSGKQAGPNPPGSGTISGMIRWTKTPVNLPASSCHDLIGLHVQTGNVGLNSPIAPNTNVGTVSMSAQPHDNGTTLSCHYEVTTLPLATPLAVRVAGNPAGWGPLGSPPGVPQGWSGVVTVSSEAVSHLDFQMVLPVLPAPPGNSGSTGNTGNGTISGSISWKKSNVKMMDTACGDLLGVHAQTAGSSALNPSVVPNTNVGTVTMSSQFLDNGTTLSCQYQVSNVPLLTPISVRVDGHIGWGVLGIPSGVPDGWSGPVTVSQVGSVSNLNFKLVFPATPGAL